MPLPVVTGEAITDYLRYARPATADRRLFVRRRAPRDKPLTVAAIHNSMNRAFMRCGLSDPFCNTHALRRTAATRLQRAGVSVKEIADLPAILISVRPETAVSCRQPWLRWHGRTGTSWAQRYHETDSARFNG